MATAFATSLPPGNTVTKYKFTAKSTRSPSIARRANIRALTNMLSKHNTITMRRIKKPIGEMMDASPAKKL
jgi:hypothetical protein